jgi:hypothetical protein
MLRLDMPTEPAWHAMPHGVRLKLRPATAALVAAADVRVRDQLKAMHHDDPEHPLLVVAKDGAVSASPTPLGVGLGFQLRAQALALYLVEAWEGVADAAGAPAPVTPESTAALMMASADLAAAFLAAVHAPLDRMTAEGNA